MKQLGHYIPSPQPSPARRGSNMSNLFHARSLVKAHYNNLSAYEVLRGYGFNLGTGLKVKPS